jgi:hypothetical protein
MVEKFLSEPRSWASTQLAQALSRVGIQGSYEQRWTSR